MHNVQKRNKIGTRKCLTTIVLSGLTLCLLLLSACTTNTNNTESGSSTMLPTPTIDASLKNQGDTQLKTFQQWIALMRQYGGDSTSYQQQYNADQQALQNAGTSTAYTTILNTLQSQIQAIQLPAMKVESQSLQQKLVDQAKSWGKQHQYHNPFDNIDYPLGFEYSEKGMGSWVKAELASAQTLADYQQVVEDINIYLTNFQAMTANASDKTPYNQPHQTDMQLMQRYDKANGQVIVVSLQEQAIRVYDNEKLVNAFLTTTGRPERPSLPGVWWVEGKQSPTVFTSGVPKTSPYWFPDTPINYAIQYHSQGYFIHDSWWRADYGPGTNFPHADSSGNAFASEGSHGCINLPQENAAWLYNFVKLYTAIIIY